MNWFRRVRIVTRCLVCFGFVLAVLAATLAVSLVAESAQTTATTHLRAADDAMRAAEQVKFRVAQLGERESSWALAVAAGEKGATDSTSPSRSALDDATTHFSDELQTLTNSSLTKAEQGKLNGAVGSYLDFTTLDANALTDYQTPGKQAEAQQLVLVRGPKLIGEVADGLDAVAASVLARESQGQAQVDSISRQSKMFAIVAGGLGIVLAIAFAVVLTLSITRPLSRLQTRLEEVVDGNGDLTRRITWRGNDEVSVLSATFNRFLDKLAPTIAQVASDADVIASAGVRSAATASQLASLASQTASQTASMAALAKGVSGTMQHMAAGIEQLTASARDIAGTAAKAARVGTDAVVDAEAAGDTVLRLGRASDAITALVSLVSGIAEQTHLLALNATIEAARAGQAGSGFAVVAAEVKGLARSTAEATEQIAERSLAIRTDSAHAAQAIIGVQQVIMEIAEFQSTIAAAVEEQTAATAELEPKRLGRGPWCRRHREWHLRCCPVGRDSQCRLRYEHAGGRRTRRAVHHDAAPCRAVRGLAATGGRLLLSLQ